MWLSVSERLPEHHLNSCCDRGFKESECSCGSGICSIFYRWRVGVLWFLWQTLLSVHIAAAVCFSCYLQGGLSLRAGAVGCVRHTANSSWRGGALLSLWMSSFALFCLSLSPELFIGNMSIIYSVYMAEYNSNYELLLVPPFSPCHTEMARKVVT